MNSFVSHRTPDLVANDSRGLPLRRVVYLRKVVNGSVESLVSREHHDVAGRLVEQRDPRLDAASEKPNLATIHSLSGAALKIDSVDAGWRLILPGLAGEVLQRWDARGHHWQQVYDEQLRLLQVAETTAPDIERFVYADVTADAGHNLRGQLSELDDASGSVTFQGFSLLGEPSNQTRTFDDARLHHSLQTFGPLDQTLTQTDAGGHQRQMRYNLAGQLKQVHLLRAGESQPQIILQDAQFNAAGQMTEQRTGNDVFSRWHFEPANGRLMETFSSVPGQAALQHFEYTYDPVGNVVRIDDHAFKPVYFANQYMDGHRTFTYDSLYRLTSATGHDALNSPDLPGRPLPSDPNDLRNYTQHYAYDHGGNLIKLIHERAVGGYTRQMSVDPQSNRALRWADNDPLPDFAAHFDAHGNQIKLQHGPNLQWNALDQLQQITLLEHDNDLPDDRETYLYSQGERVSKRHETHTSNTSHFQQVRYLPGLEIRTRDNGEELHVIHLPGNVRCLHWRHKPPADIDNDQLRYSLDDHLGSSLLELDRQARVISRETYYPFGGTALWLPSSSSAVDYKTLRYSGKEMDASGLYYYGARYYAPWLQRWISADPAGDVDGLNLYVMVANNPLRFIDTDGRALSDLFAVESVEERDERKAQSALLWQQRVARSKVSKQVERHLNILAITLRRTLNAQQQILNHRSPSAFAASMARRGATHLTGQFVAYGGGFVIGLGSQALGAVAPGAGNVAGVAMGFAAKKTISLLWDYAAERTGASASIKFKASMVSPEKIIKKAEYKTLSPLNYIQQKYAKMLPDTQKGALKATKEGAGVAISIGTKAAIPAVASEISATASAVLGGVEIVHEFAGALKELSSEKIAKGDLNMGNMINALNANLLDVKKQFSTAGVDAIHTFGFLGTHPGDSVTSLSQATQLVINELDYTRTMLRSRSHQFTAV